MSPAATSIGAGTGAAIGEAAPVAPCIERAAIAPGHDGAAELVVWVRFAGGGLDSVTLDAQAARRLLARCGAEGIDDLAGQPWEHLMHVLG